MIVQSRRSQAFLLTISILFCLALGILGYIFLRNSAGYSRGDAKHFSEIILYLSVLFTFLLAAGFTGVFIRNRNILKELDKVAEMSLYSNFSPIESLKKLSVIGEKIGQIYRNLSMVSEKRALKISAMHGLAGFLLENLSLPVLVTDVRGEIISVSRQARERLEDRHITPRTFITTLYPDLDFQTVFETMEQTRSFTEGRTEKQDLRFYPVRNREGEIAYIVCVLGKANVYTMERSGLKPKQQKKEEPKPGLLSRLRKRRKWI